MGERIGKLASRWTLVDGLFMHARVSVDPVPTERPPVVLVHGLIVSSRYMAPIAVRLAPCFQVYAPDLPGYGRSAKPAHVLNVTELADALGAWMQLVGIERAALVGNSFGCQIVADFTMRYPERVERAVLLGPTVDPRARSGLRQAARWLLNAPQESFSLGLVIARDLGDMGFRRAVGTFRFMLQDHIEEKFPRMRVPTLVVRGGRDPTVPQGWAEEAARLLPLGQLAVIPGAPHTLNYSSPLEVVRVVRPFLPKRPGDGALTAPH
jgi:2-hydroxy-6-oxonona-2,4-dienedioate hydrolase